MLHKIVHWLFGDYQHIHEISNPERYFATFIGEELMLMTIMLTKPEIAKKFSKRERDAVKLAWGEHFGEDDPLDY